MININSEPIHWSPSDERLGLPNALVGITVAPVIGEDRRLVSAGQGRIVGELTPVYIINNPVSGEHADGRYPNGTELAIGSVVGSQLTAAEMNDTAFETARRLLLADETGRSQIDPTIARIIMSGSQQRQIAVPETFLETRGHIGLKIEPIRLARMRGDDLARITRSRRPDSSGRSQG